MLNKLTLILALTLLVATAFAQEEKITITTYYPSPYGVYNQLLTNFLGVGDNDGDGTLDNNDVPQGGREGCAWFADRVGIGTRSPGGKLSVAGKVLIGEKSWVAGLTTGDLAIQGNVGIGTAIPKAKLHVYGENPQVLAQFAPHAWIGFWGAGSAIIADAENPIIISHAADPQEGGEERMRIDTEGNVGIGTTEPKGKLDVAGGISAGAYAGVNTPPSNGMIISGDVGIGTMSPESKLEVAGTAQLRGAEGGRGLYVDSSGNVGIGTMSPESKLDVAGTVQLRGAEGGRGLYVDSSGNVGIGTMSPEAKLDVLGDTYLSRKVYIGAIFSPNPYLLFVNGKAYAEAWVTSKWETPSDERLKRIISRIDNPTEKLLQLNGVKFEWKKEEYPDKGLPEGIHYGLIGQEVEKVLPEIVGGENEGYKTLSYTELIPILIEVIKEQESRIKALEARLGLR